MNLQSLKQEHQAILAEIAELQGKLEAHAKKSLFSEPDYSAKAIAMEREGNVREARYETNLSDVRGIVRTTKLDLPTARDIVESFECNISEFERLVKAELFH